MKIKFNRNQRISCITKVLIDNPNKIINLNNFTKMFNAAKSTISEDIVIVREALNKLCMGKVETVAGASGGVKYIPQISSEESKEFVDELCEILKNPMRIIVGNFIYMTDILYDPYIITRAAVIIASKFAELEIDYVITVETKGIPLAFEVAKLLGVQLLIVRRDTKVTEGTTISINYISGSSKRIQTMSLSKRAIKKGSKCIFIDDFMKAGGTANGIINLLKEFESEVLGMGVLIDDVTTQHKLVGEYISLIDFKGIDENGRVELVPSQKKHP
ncbi:Pur operon repressor [Clostridium tepidiprofundi DSM 19306]|uniref:Pur operon repressor n=1 Tax=Clostridium tepidiprofundi DSM 19306 TaxID=1121338 RepID=A0A151B369_9CLOT|nr:pur operon repressor [Clostridium tepidiprofundi]KYH34355.1 Pur operon repressor [Clostridium tepidiprofundi DSM 19306]